MIASSESQQKIVNTLGQGFKVADRTIEDQIVEIMAKYIKDNSTPKLIELVIKAIKKVEGKE